MVLVAGGGAEKLIKDIFTMNCKVEKERPAILKSQLHNLKIRCSNAVESLDFTVTVPFLQRGRIDLVGNRWNHSIRRIVGFSYCCIVRGDRVISSENVAKSISDACICD